MLLGSWVQASAGPILDIGTGTGVLALMLAQRSGTALIEAIEPDPESVLQARANIQASPWPEIQVIQTRLQDFTPDRAYELMICNPPYFDEPIRATGAARHEARHTDELSHQELLEHALRLLTPSGRLALVLPLRHGQALLKNLSGLQLLRSCEVRHSLNHPAKRLLLELGRQPGLTASSDLTGELCIRDPDGSYSAAYRALTEEYHTLAPPPEFIHARKASRP